MKGSQVEQKFVCHLLEREYFQQGYDEGVSLFQEGYAMCRYSGFQSSCPPKNFGPDCFGCCSSSSAFFPLLFTLSECPELEYPLL